MVGLGLAVSAGTTWAQAVTTAAVYGTVTGADSTTIEQATVSVTNTANGERWQTATQAGGRYTARRPLHGRGAGDRVRDGPPSGIVLSLGERERVDFHLAPSAVTLPELMVSAAADRLLNSGRTGPAQIITDTLSASGESGGSSHRASRVGSRCSSWWATITRGGAGSTTCCRWIGR